MSILRRIFRALVGQNEKPSSRRSYSPSRTYPPTTDALMNQSAVTLPGTRSCEACRDIPEPGEHKAFEFEIGAVTFQVAPYELQSGYVTKLVKYPEVTFFLNGEKLKTETEGSAFEFATRLRHREPKNIEFTTQNNGVSSAEVQFEEPSCGCGPEYIHHDPALLRINYDPKRRTLSEKRLKESQSRPIGPP